VRVQELEKQLGKGFWHGEDVMTRLIPFLMKEAAKEAAEKEEEEDDE
jgi:hypothetical protein